MSFLHPEVLYYLLPVLLIVFVYLFRKKELNDDFFSQEVMEKLRVSRNTLSAKKRNILFFLVGFFMILSLAEPIIKDGKVEVKSKSADIMIALDISDSMLAEDVYPNRLKLAKSKAMELLKLAPHERVGIVAFAKNSYLVSPMSFDHNSVGFLLRQLNTDSITEKGTDYLSLLNVVHTTIKKVANKNLLILTDGGDSEDFSDEIAFAKENNIVVYILAIGTKKGAPIKKEDGRFIKYKGEIIVSKLNVNISKFATASGGVYIEGVKSDADVKAMLREIEKASDKKELKSEIIEKFIPLFYYPLSLALLFLLLATSSLPSKKFAIPVMIFFSFFLEHQELRAGLLDFMDLDEAKEAYALEKYEKAQKIYTKYAQENNNSSTHYNIGNTLYKQHKYDEAMLSYEKASFDNNVSNARNHANIGNTYVKQGKENALANAVESYEKSLSMKEDKEVRENLETVKKEIEKQKKEEEQNKKDDKKQDQDNKGDKKDDDKKPGDKEDPKSGEEKENKDNKAKDSKDKKSKDEKDESKEKDKLDELDKKKSEDKRDKEIQEEQQAPEEKMSDAEQTKWLNMLNSEQGTYMYMLQNNKSNEENENDKPW